MKSGTEFDQSFALTSRELRKDVYTFLRDYIFNLRHI